MMEQKYIYLDYAATSPMDNRVIDEFNNQMKENYGNSSSLHAMGQKSAKTLNNSRETIASLINAERNDIFFTSSGTEADNIALLGVARRNKSRGTHIIISTIEQHAVENPCQQLEKEGLRSRRPMRGRTTQKRVRSTPRASNWSTRFGYPTLRGSRCSRATSTTY